MTANTAEDQPSPATHHSAHVGASSEADSPPTRLDMIYQAQTNTARALGRIEGVLRGFTATVARLETKISNHEGRIVTLETAQQVRMGKLGLVITAISFVVGLVLPFIKTAVSGIINGVTQH